MAFKTRYTNELTFTHYSTLARLGLPNINCEMGGDLEWVEHWSKITDDFTGSTRHYFNGRYIRCTCVNKHECFQLSNSEGKYRITSTVNDVMMVPWKREVKRRKAS